jgi:hypothetical protein
MASIPHGVTIVAQGVALPAKAGPPDIHSVDITPIPVGGGAPIKFPSQTAATQDTARIPQDLTPWINAGTITRRPGSDCNVLREGFAPAAVESLICGGLIAQAEVGR